MSTRIRAACPECGDVELQPDNIRVIVVRDATGDVGEGSRYEFDCPSCATQVKKPADDRIVSLLRGGGVSVKEVSEDKQSQHPENPQNGPAFTHDDLLDFHLDLQDDEWIEELLSSDWFIQHYE